MTRQRVRRPNPRIQPTASREMAAILERDTRARGG